MQQEHIDFQPNYLVPMTKLKTSELRSIWKDDLSFRRYVRRFWILSQKTFVESLVDDLADEGAAIDYDFTGCIPNSDGVIYFKVDRSLDSIEGFINGMNKLQKNYGLFTIANDITKKIFGNIEDDADEEAQDSLASELFKKISLRKPPQVVAYAELKKAWSAFKKNKRSQFEPQLFELVCEALDKVEHLFVSFITVSFDWITDDSHLLELIGEFVEAFKDNLWYDMMNKRFVEVVGINARKKNYD